MKVQINSDAFSGMTQWNGQRATRDIIKDTGKPVYGKSGKTTRFTLMNGGLFLREDQYSVIQ